MLGLKTRLNKFKKIEIMQSMFSDNSRIKLEINYNYKRKVRKLTNMQKLSNTLLNNQLIKETIVGIF